MKICKAAAAALVALLPWAACAQTFDYSQYKAADLDEMIAQPRPKTGVDILAQTKLKIVGTLTTYGEACNTAFLKKAMLTAGLPQAAIDAVPLTRCIKLRSAKGKEIRLYIQDLVAEALPKEIALGDPVTLFVLRVFNNADGPGLLANEFSADSDGSVRKQLAQLPAAAKRGAEKQTADNNSTRGLRGEWRRAGPSFVCQVDSQGKVSSDASNPDALIKACLHMGPFGIGDAAESIKSALGPPPRTLSQPDDATAWIYFLDQPQNPPYLVVTVKKNKVVALQASGPATSKDFTFNHVKLGDGTQVIVDYFGAAFRTKPSGEKDTDLWSYPPWPFSFEVKNGLVTSLRIADPTYQE